MFDGSDTWWIAACALGKEGVSRAIRKGGEEGAEGLSFGWFVLLGRGLCQAEMRKWGLGREGHGEGYDRQWRWKRRWRIRPMDG